MMNEYMMNRDEILHAWTRSDNTQVNYNFIVLTCCHRGLWSRIPQCSAKPRHKSLLVVHLSLERPDCSLDSRQLDSLKQDS